VVCKRRAEESRGSSDQEVHRRKIIPAILVCRVWSKVSGNRSKMGEKEEGGSG